MALPAKLTNADIDRLKKLAPSPSAIEQARFYMSLYKLHKRQKLNENVK